MLVQPSVTGVKNGKSTRLHVFYSLAKCKLLCIIAIVILDAPLSKARHKISQKFFFFPSLHCSAELLPVRASNFAPPLLSPCDDRYGRYIERARASYKLQEQPSLD